MDGGSPPSLASTRTPPKRRHSQMEAGYRQSPSPSPLFVRQNSLSADRESAPRLARPPPSHLLRLPHPVRRHGDGLDFRRPAATSSTVIDLTDDDDSTTHSSAVTPQADLPPHPSHPPHPPHPPRAQRLPRYHQEIIDLSGEGSPQDERHVHRREPERTQPRAHVPAENLWSSLAPVRDPPAQRSRSPEVQFVSERQLPPPTRARIQDRVPTPFQPDVAQDNTVDLTEDDELVQLLHVRRAALNLQRPQPAPERARGNGFGVGAALTRMFQIGPIMRPGGNRHLNAVMRELGPYIGIDDDDDDDYDDDEDDFNHRHNGELVLDPHRPRPFAHVLPGTMNYQAPAFTLGNDPGAPIRTATPPYRAPLPVAEPFSRTPTEEDVLVCPNCGEELAQGDTDEKRQVWIVKACGHVYCGHCMAHRKQKQKGKQKVTEPALPKAFRTCQAPGCDGPTNKNHVMQVFL